MALVKFGQLQVGRGPRLRSGELLLNPLHYAILTWTEPPGPGGSQARWEDSRTTTGPQQVAMPRRADDRAQLPTEPIGGIPRPAARLPGTALAAAALGGRP